MGFNSSTNPMIHEAAHEESNQSSKDRPESSRWKLTDRRIGPLCPVNRVPFRNAGFKRDGSIESLNRGNFSIAIGETRLHEEWDVPFFFRGFQRISNFHGLGRVLSGVFSITIPVWPGLVWEIELECLGAALEGFQLICVDWYCVLVVCFLFSASECAISIAFNSGIYSHHWTSVDILLFV